MSDRTWNWPYHLLTPLSSVTESVLERSRAALAAMMCSLTARLAARTLVELDLEKLAVSRHRKTEDEIDEGGEQIDFGGEAGPERIDKRRIGGVEEVEDA